MQARPSASLVVGKSGGRDAFLPPCGPCLSHSCLFSLSLHPSDSPPHQSKLGNGMLGLPSVSPSLAIPNREQDHSVNVEVACTEQTAEDKTGWKVLSSTVFPTAHMHTTPKKCSSARQLMRAIKGCDRWSQLFDLAQAHSPQNLCLVHPTNSNSQRSSSAYEHPYHAVASPTPSTHPHADLPTSPSTASADTQLPWQASDLEAPTINHIHLAAILTHLAQLRADPSSDSALQAWCMELLHQVVQPHVLQALSIRHLANIMWACARLGMHGDAQPQHPQVRTQHKDMSAAGAGGLGKLSSSDSGVRAWGGGRHTGLQARCWKVLLGAHGQRMREASLLMRAEQQQQHNLHPPKVQQRQQQQQQQQQDLRPPHAHQQQQQDSHPPNAQQQQQQQDLQPPHVVHQQHQQQQHPLCMHDMVHVVYACALAGQNPGGEWLALSLQCSRPLLPHMKPAEAASWAYALCALGVCPDDEWAFVYMKVSAGLLGAMTPHELALTLRGAPCIIKACSSGVREACVESGSSSSSSSSRSSSSGSSGLSPTTGKGLQEQWQQACFAALSRALPDLDPLHASAALWGLSLLGWRPQPPLMAALLHVTVHGQHHAAAEDAANGRRELGMREQLLEQPGSQERLQVASVEDRQSNRRGLPENVEGRLQKQTGSPGAAAEGAGAGSAAKDDAGAAGVRHEGWGASQGGRGGLNAVQGLQGNVARQRDGLGASHGGSSGSVAGAARAKGGGSEDGVAALGSVAPEVSSRCAANVLTSTARLGAKPSGAWVGQLLDALIVSARVQGGREQSAATHSNSSSSSSSSSSSNMPGVSAPGHDAACLNPFQQQQQQQRQQQQQQRPCQDRATASRLLADVNASMLACVLLRYQPPPHVMHQLVSLALEGLPWASPAEMADMLWAVAKLRYVPHRAWLAACFSATGRVLHRQALQLQHLRKQLAQQRQELQELQEGGGARPTLAPPHPPPLPLQHDERPTPPSQQDKNRSRHQEELHSTSRQPQGKVNHHQHGHQLQPQLQQQLQQQPQPGALDSFNAHTLCKLMWALASLSQMQRASMPHMGVGRMVVAPLASARGATERQVALPSHPQPVDTLASPSTRSDASDAPAGAADQLGLPSQSHVAQQNQQQQQQQEQQQEQQPGSQTQQSQHSPSQQSSAGSSSPPCSTPSSAPPPHQRTRSRRRYTSLARPLSPSLRPSPPPSQVPVSPQGAPPPSSPSAPTPPPQQHLGAALHDPATIPGAPVVINGGALPPRAPTVSLVPAAPTRSLDSEVDTGVHTFSQPVDALASPSLPSQAPPAAAPPRIPMQQPPLLPPAWLEACLAVLHTHIPHMEPQHLPEVLWALATLDAIPPAVSRRRLAAAVSQHVGQLSPKHVAAVVGGLPRVCVTRAHDSCGMLGPVLGAGRATLRAMQPKELTYYLRGLHGMGYVLSKKALLQLAADLASYPHLQRLGAKDLVAVVDALAGLDMGLLPVTAEFPSKSSNSTSNSSSSSSGSSSSHNSSASRKTSGSRKTRGRSRRKNSSIASSQDDPVPNTASRYFGTSTPVLQLQSMLLGRLQPQLKYLQLSQIASLVTALTDLGWRPPSSFWPCLYASIALKPAPPSGRVPAAVLLALAKYGAMAAAVEEADAAAAALRAESSGVRSSGTGMESSCVSTGPSSAGPGSSKPSSRATGQVTGAAPTFAPLEQTPAERQAPSASNAATAAATAPKETGSAGRGGNTTGSGAQRVRAEGETHGSLSAACGGSNGAAAGGDGGGGIKAAGDGISVNAASNGGPKTASSGNDGVAAQGAGGVPLHSKPQHDQFLLPPGVLVQRLLDFVTGDLAALRPSEVAELVLALVRLRHDPGGSWMRALLDHLETRSAACNREDHQLLQRAWRRLSRARKAGLVRTPRKQHYLQATEKGGGERGTSYNSRSSSSSMLRKHASSQVQHHCLPYHKQQQQ